MNLSQLNKWLEKIYASQEVEISCSVCFEMIDLFVDHELTGIEVVSDLTPIKEHIHQCRVCQEEYELLRELAQAQA